MRVRSRFSLCGSLRKKIKILGITHPTPKPVSAPRRMPTRMAENLPCPRGACAAETVVLINWDFLFELENGPIVHASRLLVPLKRDYHRDSSGSDLSA